jgi:hypothetical protein
MAERDAGRPEPGALSTEEADRLSERFRPSWEADADPPTVPRIAPSPPGRAVAPRPLAGAPAAPAPAAKPVAPAAQPAPPGAANRTDTADAARSPTPTLVGIQRTIAVGPSAAPDDLDWEAPAQASAPEAAPRTEARAPLAAPPSIAEPEAPVPIDVEELPPDSSEPLSVEVEELPPDSSEPLSVEVEELPPPSIPSGIGQTYVPKDQNAPAIVLNEEVQAAEAEARSRLEAQHRSRRAQTIVRMRVEDLGLPSVPEEPPPFAPRRKTGLWLGLASVLLVAVAAGAFLLMRKPGGSGPAVATGAGNPAAAQPAAEPAAAIETSTPERREPPGATSPEPAHVAGAAEPSVVPVPGVVAAPGDSPASSASGEPAAKTAARGKAKPAPAGAAKPAQASKPGAAKPASKGVIVRDSPF